MAPFLKFLPWPASGAPKLKAWTIDRLWHRDQGKFFLENRQYEEAERHLLLAWEGASQLHASRARMLRVALQLARAQRELKKFEDAERTLRKAIEALTRDSGHPGYLPGYLQCLDALADLFWASGNYFQVETVVREAICIESGLPHPDQMRMARRVHRLGMARYKTGPSEDALPALERGFELHEQAYGPEHWETHRILSELGSVYRAQGRHKEAQRCLRRALRYHQEHLGPDHPDSLQDLYQLAGSLEEAGQIEEAAAEYERLIERKRGAGGNPGGDAEALAQIQFSLAHLYLGWGKYARARELLAECIASFEAAGGARLAAAYETQAQAEEHLGQVHDAIRSLDRAGEVWEGLGDRKSELAANLESRAELLEQLRRKREAAWFRDRAARLLDPVQEA